MSNLWILTEERPKNSVIDTILRQYAADFDANYTCGEDLPGIRPIVENGRFTFGYIVEGVSVSGIQNVYIETVSGNSSFVDYLVIRQWERPCNHSLQNILMAVEETKTSDAESRNTGIYQRATKFAYAEHFCPEAKKYMLFNEEMTPERGRIPSDTNIFGTNMLLSLGITFIGKNMTYFAPFASVDELIQCKNAMRDPNPTNTPIHIIKEDNCIYISGKLDKKNHEGTISHDPSIGALTCIGFSLRKLGWRGDIVITRHNITQQYINRARGNKCLYLFQLLNIKMQGLTLGEYPLDRYYWNYCMSSEKVGSIFLHMTCLYSGITSIYENHAGCERSYFKTHSGRLLALPKKDERNRKLLLPDVVLRDDEDLCICNVEGKMLSTMYAGIDEVETYDAIEQEFIRPHYPEYEIQRWVCVFGGADGGVPHEKVLLYLNENGEVYLNGDAPANIKEAFRKIGIWC